MWRTSNFLIVLMFYLICATATVNVWLTRAMSITATLTFSTSWTPYKRKKIKAFFNNSSTFQNLACAYFQRSVKDDFIQNSPLGDKTDWRKSCVRCFTLLAGCKLWSGDPYNNVILWRNIITLINKKMPTRWVKWGGFVVNLLKQGLAI